MRVIWLIASFFLAIGLELYAWNILLTAEHENVFANIMALHFLSSVIGALGCLLIRIGYDNHKAICFILFFVMIIVIPAFGLLGVYTAVLHALYYPKKRREILWKGVPVPELPYMPVQVSAHPTYGEGGLASVIQFSGDLDRRVNAVIAAKQINEKMAIPLLQEALKDPEDDVRLFAYAVLDAKTTNITERISGLLAEVELTEGQVKARHCYALAQNYWELAFLGLTTGNTLVFILQQAERYANQAAELGWSGSDIEFLIGRIYLYQKKYEQAQKYFCLSLEHGALESAILPFLSEISYETYEFHHVRTLIDRLNTCCDGNSPIPAVVKSWSVAS